MADKIPIRGGFNGGSLTGLAQFASGDTLGVAHGGTGVVTIGSNALVTGNGTSAMTSESNLTFDGTILKSTGDLCATVKVVAPALCIGSEYVLPTADGSAGQLMCTDGSGALAFATVAATSPGGSDTQIQFNNSGAFGASSNLTWDDTTLAIGNSSAADYLALRLYQGGGTTYYWDFTADVDAGDLIIGGNHSSFDLILNPSYGNVGIGTTAPASSLIGDTALLQIYGAVPAVGLKSSTSSSTHEATFAVDGSGLYIESGGHATASGNNFIKFRTEDSDGSFTATDRMIITNDGRVGVGTHSPCHTFQSLRNTTTADIFAGSFKDTTSSYQLQVHGTSGNVTGTHIENYMESPSPADGDFVGLYSAQYKDSGGNKVVMGTMGWFTDDVTAGTIDSKMEFKTKQNNATKIAYLTAAGVWTDASAAAGKDYLGTRQEVWPDGILASLKTLNVSKYKPADQPEDKPVTETHVSPTAEDFWDALQIGTDPRAVKLNKDGENTNSPTISAKDLGGVALVAIQELLERVEALESA